MNRGRSKRQRLLRLAVVIAASGILAWLVYELPRWASAHRSGSEAPSPSELKSYEDAVAELAVGNTEERVFGALDTFRAAGTKAFPILIAHTRDTAKASSQFQHVVFDVHPDGESTFHAPTIGDACFDIIQSQVEGQWQLKAYDQYHVLSPDTIKPWWESHKTKSLRELRLESAQLSLETARRNSHANAIEFLTAHLQEVRQN